MKISLNWIKALIELPAEKADSIQSDTTLNIAETEHVIVQQELFACMQVVAIDAVEPHPDADRLRLVTVNTGQEALQIVCGAPNVETGVQAILASPGAVIDGTVLEPAVIRGIKSNGMLLSEKELGISDNHDGILLIDEHYQPGTPAAEALGFTDTILDIDNHAITHRPDLWCHRGMAREYAAMYSVPAPAEISPDLDTISGELNISIEVPELCQRYTGALIEGITIGPSPWELQCRLLACGIRPINNIVDITNLVMLEVGEPMHAFDADKVKDNTIIVRRAMPDEAITTLDGQNRDLNPESMVIADPEKAIALAGVMGGLNSEVTDTTTNIILEAATFNHVNIRNTRIATGLQSEATSRFEKGLMPELTGIAIKRACALIKEILPDAAVTAITDTGIPENAPRIITLTEAHLQRLTGQPISIKDACDGLEAMGYLCTIKATEAEIEVPWWRKGDTALEVDLIEDAARVYGLDKLKPVMPSLPINAAPQPPMRLLEKQLRNILSGAGADEVMTYSFAPESALCAFSMNTAKHLALENPLDSNLARLRQSLLPGMIEGFKRNMPVFNELNVYEIGRIYFPNSTDKEELPGNEQNRLNLLVYRKNAETVYQETAAYAEVICTAFNLEFNLVRASDIPDTHPQRTARIMSTHDTCLGYVGEIAPEITKTLRIKERVGVLEIDLDAWLCCIENSVVAFTPVPRYPSINREFSMISPADLDFCAIADTVLPLDALIQSVDLITVYSGPPIPDGSKSISFSVLLQDPQRTLSDEDANKVQEQIVDVLKKNLNLQLREG